MTSVHPYQRLQDSSLSITDVWDGREETGDLLSDAQR